MPDHQKDPVIDPTARVIVNKNFDTTNIVDMDSMERRILKTLNTCESVLKAHCGPQSGYAMLVENFSAGEEFRPNVFTRDGIRILSAVEFMSPLERHIKEILTYIGTRVDANAKDGTTTSMLFATVFLKEILAVRKKMLDLGFTFFQVNQLVDTIFEQIKAKLDTYTFSVERIAQVQGLLKPKQEPDEATAIKVAGEIAAMQALSSSGGNLQLALAMKEIFERSPKVAWEFISYYQSKKETGKSFQVEVDDFDARLRCIAASDGNLNRAMNTEYYAERVLCLIYPDALMDGSLKLDGIFTWLHELPIDQPVLVMATYYPAHLVAEVNSLNQSRGDNRITLWQYSPEQKIAGVQLPWELLTLCAISGIEPFSMDTETDTLSEKHLFTAESVYWHDTYLDFSGVVSLPEGSCLHPFYADPEKATHFYAQTLQAVKDQIRMYQEGHKPDGRMMNLFIEILNKLACVKRPTLRLGGPVHEQLANADVVQDVEGAIMSSLKHGFLINGVFSLNWAVGGLLLGLKNIQQKPGSAVMADMILSAMSTALSTVLNATFRTATLRELMEKIGGDQKAAEMVNDPNLYLNVLDPQDVNSIQSYLEILAGYSPTDTLDDPYQTTLCQNYPVLQPRAIADELLTRTKELLIKFVFTDKIVIAGGVVAEEETPAPAAPLPVEDIPTMPDTDPIRIDTTRR